MKKLASILLLGCLSMFFGEVLSGGSQAWFISGWGLSTTLPLYLSHTLFFLLIAIKFKKISFSQLYFFGILFSLYESWITKVFWAGSFHPGREISGVFLGLGVAEFPMVALFWHPVMSFIVPILVFEILTGKFFIEHDSVLQKTKRKTLAIIAFLILTSTFIASESRFDQSLVNFSIIGTIMIILVLYYFVRKTDIKIFDLGKFGLSVTTAFVIAIYIGAFFLILPERIPQTPLPYISIIVSYIIAIALITKTKKTSTELSVLNQKHYSMKHLVLFSFVTILSANIASTIPEISAKILIGTYIGLIFFGITLFFLMVRSVFKKCPQPTL